jgi:2-oxoisovalerate dehydrogenase E2 component (dihydrolipoyl transacylase)
MFKAMTKSLSIPHFGYSDEIILDKATEFRQAVNAYLASNPAHGIKKMSYMPIFLKALSLSLNKYPLLNASLQSDENANTAQLVYRSEHHVGVAMDTPQG